MIEGLTNDFNSLLYYTLNYQISHLYGNSTAMAFVCYHLIGYLLYSNHPIVYMYSLLTLL